MTDAAVPSTRTDPRCYALVPCAGTGSRSGAVGPKQYVPLAGRPLVLHTLAALDRVERLSAVLVVLAPDDRVFDGLRPAATARPLWSTPRGGATRADTVAQGLQALREHGARDDDWVLVHDAARCLLPPDSVDALIDACLEDAVGGLLALPLADTLKQSTTGGDRVAATVDRGGKWQAQTPQMFRLGLLQRALAEAGSEPARAAAITDEASAIEALGLAPRLVAGTLDNFKVTWPADFALAERLLRSRDLEPDR